MGSGDERRISYCPYCGAKIDPSFRYCPYCGSSLSSVESATDTMSGGVEGVDARIYKSFIYRGKPLSSRAFGIAALILWILYMFLLIVALSTDVRVLGDCDNAINSAISVLERANSAIGSVFMRIPDIDEIIRALRMVQIGNYLYIAIEILSIIIIPFTLYYIAIGRPHGLKTSVVSIFTLQILGGAIAWLLSTYGLETLRRYLSMLPQSIYNMVTKYIDRLSLIQRTIESIELFIAISIAIAVILITISYLAYREMKK